MEDVIKDEAVLNEFGNDDWEESLLNNDVRNDLFSETATDIEEKDLPRKEHLKVLLKCFGHKKFRPLQWKIINSIMKYRQDNCAIMTTGYGKSLCYQYPSAYLGSVSIVISPLISLMEDQILSLTMANIPACLLGSAQSQQKQVIDDIFEGKYTLVYMTPEFCTGECGKEIIRKMYNDLVVTLIAIDEAHCVSTWGHDFRFSYRQLGMLKDLLPDVPILAVTATATPKVQNDIIKTMNLKVPQVLCSGFDRPNLHFTVCKKGNNVFNDLRKVMVRKGGKWTFSGSTIIYCITRKNTEDISMILKAQDINCLPYHAGLPLKVRKETHEKFVRDKIQIIVATIAFGMGIDKPDVRNIIHYGTSSSIESYYQEVGRAGRDGLPAKCVVFYSNLDFDTHQRLREEGCASAQTKQNKENMAHIMLEYLSTRKCRRHFILSHFEGKENVKLPKTRPNCCDNCEKTKEQPDTEIYEGLDKNGLYDFTKDAEIFLSSINAMGGSFGIGTYILFIRGSNSSKIYERYQRHALHGSGKHQTENWWKAIASLLEQEQFLKKVYTKNGNKFGYFTYQVSEKGENFYREIKNGNTLLRVPPTEVLQLLKRKTQAQSQWLSVSSSTHMPSTSKTKTADEENPTEKNERMKLYRLLMNKRSELATQNSCMPYMVASNAALMEIAAVKPSSLQHLRDMQADGLTEAKILKFGQEFLKIINADMMVKNDEPRTGKKSIQDILTDHPMPINFSMTIQVSYSLFKSGLSVQEIATKRKLSEVTINGHLAEAMKAGYPIKMIDLGVTKEARDIILNVINTLDTGYSLLTPIKQACPEEITYSQIKVVAAYLQIREYLKQLNIPYEEFEDFTYNISNKNSQNDTCDSDNSNDSNATRNIDSLLKAYDELNDSDDEQLLNACDELENSINEEKEAVNPVKEVNLLEEDSDDTLILDDEPPLKKIKSNENDKSYSVLDSPPRASSHKKTEESTKEENNSEIVNKNNVKKTEECTNKETKSGNGNKNKKKLPPWLAATRIA